MQEITVDEVIRQHAAAGRYFTVDGLQSFALGVGAGEPVFCLHGVPTSSFLYRKLVREMVAQGIALGLDKYHLVVHDIGGPIGFAPAAAQKSRILSLTILNTWIDVDTFEKPLPMRPFEIPVLGQAELALLTHTTWQAAFSTLAASDTTGIATAETHAYIDLLKREDGGKAFLQIMRHFEKSVALRATCYQAVQHTPYPVQAIWGAEDPGLTYARYGQEIKAAAHLQQVHQLRAKHLLQEDKWQEIASLVVQQARSAAATSGK